MKENLITDDITRCDNHRCESRTHCARYMQVGIDFSNYREKHKLSDKTPIYNQVFKSIPFTRFPEAEKCEFQIPIEK